MLGLSTSVMAYDRTGRKRRQTFWGYDRNDPAAVTVRIPTGNAGVWTEWVISRTMLGDAYLDTQYRYGGEVHLRVLPGGERLVLTLYPDADHPAVISFPSAEVWEFLLKTHRTMPPCPNDGRCVGIACPECTAVAIDLDSALIGVLNGGE